jgi:hypothetical protein
MIIQHNGCVYKILKYDRPRVGDFILATDEDHSTPAIWQTQTEWPENAGAFVLAPLSIGLNLQ